MNSKKKGDALALVKNVVGMNITGIWLMKFSYKSQVNSTNTPLQLCFDDNKVMLFDVAPDGETIRIRDRSWIEPFIEPLSEKNIRFVRDYGKWEMVNISNVYPFNMLIGKAMDSADPILNNKNILIGLKLHFTGLDLKVFVEWDEIKVETLIY